MSKKENGYSCSICDLEIALQNINTAAESLALAVERARRAEECFDVRSDMTVEDRQLHLKKCGEARNDAVVFITESLNILESLKNEKS